MLRFRRFVVLFVSASNLLSAANAYARTACTTNVHCEQVYRPGSKCVDGQCRNSFEAGCLRAVLGGDRTSLRTCNSDDPPDAAERGLCEASRFGYPEVRILNQNWQSTMFLAWVMQILLSEVANVPVTIETGSPDLRASFYDPDLKWDYATMSYDYDALRRANERPGGSCVGADEPCAHVMPELWSGQKKNWGDAKAEGLVEPAEGNGQFGKYDWNIPQWVAEEDPTLLSFYGLAGEENRRKLAERFKRPTNWRDYCSGVSETNCLPGKDEFAARPPNDEEEGDSYFIEGLFRGYFNATEKNDCDANPTTCTGHFVDRSCDSSTFFVQQVHWLGVALESDGPLPNGGYPSKLIAQVWMAANATNSSVMALYARPNPVIQEWEGTNSAFQPILLPRSNAKCVANRVSQEERCSSDLAVRVGNEAGRCDSEQHALMKLVVSSLYKTTYEEAEARRSPAYEVIKNLKVPTIEMEDIFGRWLAGTVDEREYDARMAVCSWVADNIEDLQNLMPYTYPRELEEESFYDLPLLYVSLVMGGIAVVSLVVCAALTYQWRKKKVMVYAQPTFLFMIVAGLFLVAVASILYAVPPLYGSCIAKQWLVTLGYSLELVPLLVKIAAINRLFQQAKKMKRVTINRKILYSRVGGILFVVCVYLTVWTAVDPPTRQSKMALTDKTTADGAYIVETEYFCASSSGYWQIIATLYLIALLLSASVLATQNRNIRQEFNESKFLAIMIYSHFIFVILRLLLFLFRDALENASAVSGATSLLLSFDTLTTVCIYFVPKFYNAKKTEGNYTPSAASTPSHSAPSLSALSQRDSNYSEFSSGGGNVASNNHLQTGPAHEDMPTNISDTDKAKMERRVSWSDANQEC